MLDNREIDFIIELLEKTKRKYNGFDVLLEDTKLHNVDIYFLQNKLEKLKAG